MARVAAVDAPSSRRLAFRQGCTMPQRFWGRRRPPPDRPPTRPPCCHDHEAACLPATCHRYHWPTHRCRRLRLYLCRTPALSLLCIRVGCCYRPSRQMAELEREVPSPPQGGAAVPPPLAIMRQQLLAARGTHCVAGNDVAAGVKHWTEAGREGVCAVTLPVFVVLLIVVRRDCA